LQPNPPSQHLQQVGLSQRLWRHSQLNRQQSGGLLSAVGRLISSGSGDLITKETSGGKHRKRKVAEKLAKPFAL